MRRVRLIGRDGSAWTITAGPTGNADPRPERLPMATPFTAITTTVAGTTPVQIATWQRGDSGFAVLVRTDQGNSAPIYLTNSPAGTLASAFVVLPGDLFGFDVPAKASAYAPTPPPEFMYAFTTLGDVAEVSVLIEPR